MSWRMTTQLLKKQERKLKKEKKEKEAKQNDKTNR